MKVIKTNAKPVNIIIDIRPAQGTTYQRKLWVHIWQKLITECQCETEGESEAKK